MWFATAETDSSRILLAPHIRELRLTASTDLMKQPAASQTGLPLPRWQLMPQSRLQQVLSSPAVRQSLPQRHPEPQSLRLQSWLRGQRSPRLQARQMHRLQARQRCHLQAQKRQVCLQRAASGSATEPRHPDRAPSPCTLRRATNGRNESTKADSRDSPNPPPKPPNAPLELAAAPNPLHQELCGST